MYHAPTPQPAYAPPARVVSHPAVKPKAVHRRKHKRRHHAQARHVAPKLAGQVKHAAVVRVAGVPATVTNVAQDNVTRAFVASGIGLAAFLFLVVVTVPATAARFTPPGRVIMDHQTDLVLGGLAVLVLTALLYIATGSAS